MNLSSIGEFDFIDGIKDRVKEKIAGVVGIGDDCAIIECCDDKELLVSVDALVEGVHFFSEVDPYLLGRKSLAVNISDVAAMAGIPRWCFLSLSIGSNVDKIWLDAFIEGFLSVANEFDVTLLGGDTTKSDKTVINVTIIGENKKGNSIKRSGAKPGDLVVVSGEIGCSYAGLKAIELGINGFLNLKTKHLDPTPRVKEALEIGRISTAMIDISDGLIQDCEHIARMSKVGVEIFWDYIPFCGVDFVSKEDLICGGEDYEILACVKSKYSIPTGFSVIGRVKEGRGVNLVKDGKIVRIENCGYRHF